MNAYRKIKFTTPAQAVAQFVAILAMGAAIMTALICL